jgi:hypothetical protein
MIGTGKRRNLCNPAAILFAINLDFEHHDHLGWRERG